MSKEIAIDLGTANSLVYVQGKGIVIREQMCIRDSSKPWLNPLDYKSACIKSDLTFCYLWDML